MGTLLGVDWVDLKGLLWSGEVESPVGHEEEVDPCCVRCLDRIGVLITFVSGFLRNLYLYGTFPFVMFAGVPVPGISNYGHPLPWLWVPVVEVLPPPQVNWANLGADVVFWSFIVLAVFLGARRILGSR